MLEAACIFGELDTRISLQQVLFLVLPDVKHATSYVFTAFSRELFEFDKVSIAQMGTFACYALHANVSLLLLLHIHSTAGELRFTETKQSVQTPCSAWGIIASRTQT